MPLSPQALHIMLVDDQPPRAALLARSLEDGGHRVLCRLTSAAGLLERILALRPDLILMDMDAPDRDALESLAMDEDAGARPRPLVTLGAGRQALVIAALSAGVSVYASDGLDAGVLDDTVTLAAARYREYRALRDELEHGGPDAAGGAVERARALLMARRRLGERDADALLRRHALGAGQPLPVAARSLLASAALLKAEGPR